MIVSKQRPGVLQIVCMLRGPKTWTKLGAFLKPDCSSQHTTQN